LNTNPWSAAAALTLSLEEGSVAMMAGFVDTLGLKKVGTPSGNVPVVGDGSDCDVDKRTGEESNKVVGLKPGGIVRYPVDRGIGIREGGREPKRTEEEGGLGAPPPASALPAAAAATPAEEEEEDVFAAPRAAILSAKLPPAPPPPPAPFPPGELPGLELSVASSSPNP